MLENAKVALNLNQKYRAYAIAQVGGVLLEETQPLLASRPQVNIEFAAI